MKGKLFQELNIYFQDYEDEKSSLKNWASGPRPSSTLVYLIWIWDLCVKMHKSSYWAVCASDTNFQPLICYSQSTFTLWVNRKHTRCARALFCFVCFWGDFWRQTFQTGIDPFDIILHNFCWGRGMLWYENVHRKPAHAIPQKVNLYRETKSCVCFEAVFNNNDMDLTSDDNDPHFTLQCVVKRRSMHCHVIFKRKETKSLTFMSFLKSSSH